MLTLTHRPIAQADGDPGDPLPTTFEMVVRAFEAAYGPSAYAITPDTLIHEDLGIDHLAFALVVAIVEDVSGKTVPDSAAMRMRTVGDLVRWVDEHVPADRITS